MPGTVGPNSEITLVAPGGVSGVTGPDGRPKGINYSFVGIFVAIALLTVFIVGIVAVRRRKVWMVYVFHGLLGLGHLKGLLLFLLPDVLTFLLSFVGE